MKTWKPQLLGAIASALLLLSFRQIAPLHIDFYFLGSFALLILTLGLIVASRILKRAVLADVVIFLLAFCFMAYLFSFAYKS